MLVYSGQIIGCPPVPQTGGCGTNVETTINELDNVRDLKKGERRMCPKSSVAFVLATLLLLSLASCNTLTTQSSKNDKTCDYLWPICSELQKKDFVDLTHALGADTKGSQQAEKNQCLIPEIALRVQRKVALLCRQWLQGIISLK